MKTIKKLWGEFKKFISRGNVLDLAVAVVIGAAFTAIVNSLTNDIIMPLINWAVGDGDLSSLCTVLHAVYTTDANGAQILDLENSLVINWGTFIQAIIDFILVALVIFAIVKIINTVREAGTKLGDAAKKEKELSKLSKKFVKQGMTKEEARVAAEEKYAADHAPAPEEPKKPTVEELLTQIKDLLAANQANAVGDVKDSAEEPENK